MNKIRIVFMGTPDFAVPSLLTLVAHKYPIAAVVTAPDKPQGRGNKVIPSPIKIFAQQHEIPVLQPTNLQSASFIEALYNYQADLYVVVAFRMLPKLVWTQPALGTINLHASYLPYYRGAAPINWAILQGERVTGITTFFIDEKMDTGHILFQEKEPIYSVDTAGTLTKRLQYKGARLLLKTVQAIETGHYMTTAQATLPEEIRTQAPKIYNKDCQIDWQQPTEMVYNFIRGLSPHPGAWTIFNHTLIKILETYPLPLHLTDAGEVCSDGKSYLYIGTQDGAMAIEELQPAGKKVMSIRAFLSGHKLL